MYILYLHVFECVYAHPHILEFANFVVPVIIVGFSSQLIKGSESGGTSHLKVSWNVSGSAPDVTHYYIRPLMYKDFNDGDATITASFSQTLGSNNNDLLIAAVQGSAMMENA